MRDSSFQFEIISPSFAPYGMIGIVLERRKINTLRFLEYTFTRSTAGSVFFNSLFIEGIKDNKKLLKEGSDCYLFSLPLCSFYLIFSHPPNLAFNSLHIVFIL